MLVVELVLPAAVVDDVVPDASDALGVGVEPAVVLDVAPVAAGSCWLGVRSLIDFRASSEPGGCSSLVPLGTKYRAMISPLPMWWSAGLPVSAFEGHGSPSLPTFHWSSPGLPDSLHLSPLLKSTFGTQLDHSRIYSDDTLDCAYWRYLPSVAFLPASSLAYGWSWIR